MIAFISLCALMLLLAIALIGWPLLRRADGVSTTTRLSASRLSVFVLTSLSVCLLAAAVYITNSNWSWQGTPQSDAAVASTQENELANEIGVLLGKSQSEPGNAENWKLLGRAYVSGGQFALGGNAYQRAYELTKGRDVEVLTGLAEALVLADQTSLNGRVGLLIDEALLLDANNPKALWYGGMVAMQMDNLPLARDRFKAMLALNPPPQIRTLLERQIQDLSQQLGDASPAPASASGTARKVLVKVTLSPALQQQIKAPLSLFIVARDPLKPGPPLAVERHQSSELPLQVELSADDAMLPSRTLGSAEAVQIVARLSASGTPTEQSGDLFGSADYSFKQQGEQGTVNVEISQRVP